MGQIVQDIFARRDVDANIVPFLGWNFRQPALHQRFAGRDDLDDSGVAIIQVTFDGPNQRGRFHRREQMAEETLLGGLERRAGGGLGLAV